MRDRAQQDLFSLSAPTRRSDAEAIARLDLLLADFSDPTIVGPTGTARIRRLSERRARIWMDDDGISTSLVVSVDPGDAPGDAGDADVLTVLTVIVETIEFGGVARWLTPRTVRRRVARGLAEAIHREFDPALDDPNAGERPDPSPTDGPPDRRRSRGDGPLPLDRQLDQRFDAALAAPRAIDVTTAATQMRARTRVAIAGLVIAAASIPATIACGVAEENALAALGRDGQRVTAVVIEDGGDDHVRLRFTTGGVEREATYSRPDHRYRLGQEVRILASDDGRTIDLPGEDFWAPYASDAFGATALAMFVSWAIAPVFAVRTFRQRRALARHPFVEQRARRIRLESKGGAALVSLGDETRPVKLVYLLRRRQPSSPRWQTVLGTGRWLSAGPADHAVVALGHPDALVRVAHTRNPLRRWWWRWLLERDGTAPAVDPSP